MDQDDLDNDWIDFHFPLPSGKDKREINKSLKGFYGWIQHGICHSPETDVGLSKGLKRVKELVAGRGLQIVVLTEEYGNGGKLDEAERSIQQEIFLAEYFAEDRRVVHTLMRSLVKLLLLQASGEMPRSYKSRYPKLTIRQMGQIVRCR
jgi:hypothetical protein